MCGYSITEYIRNRGLALAGQELLAEDISVMELAMKYGYDAPDKYPGGMNDESYYSEIWIPIKKTA